MDLNAWTPTSWEGLKVSQQPVYSNIEDANTQLDLISQESDGITEYKNIESLRELLKQVNNNESLLLIAGDCSEPFEESDANIVDLKCALLNYLAFLLYNKYNKKVLILGRIAGQYAKPRTNDYEIVDSAKLYCYRGDLINSFNIEERDPDPKRLTLGFKTAKKVKKCINEWNERSNQSVSLSETYQFFEYFRKRGICWSTNEFTNKVENNVCYDDTNRIFSPIYICHEGLHLSYESRLIKYNEQTSEYYSTSADMLWIGERTNKLAEAHMEFFRGIANPIGIKVSLNTNLEDLINSIQILNPSNKEGKLILITRMGYNNQSTETYLHLFAKKIKESNLRVSIICDAMHGNTMLDGKHKIRRLEDMINEINLTSDILQSNGIPLNGLHIESTPHFVTECLDDEITAVFDKSYTTLCDPRLNFKQSIELITRVKI